jgi:signal transduction histidine kinase/ActR/RegA family two-component response regulator
MLSGMNGLFAAMQRGGGGGASTQTSVAWSRIEALDRAVWRTRFRDPSELKLAADALAQGEAPDSLAAGLAEFHRAWHCLALFDQPGAAAKHDEAHALFELHRFDLGIDRLRAVKALILLRAGKSQAALDSLNAAQRSAVDEPLPEARYVALNLRALCNGDLGDLDESMRSFSAALTAARLTGIPVFEANALGNFGGFHADIHNFEDAERMCREAFALADAAGARAPWVTSGTNWMLALFYLGRHAEARNVALQLLAREAWLLPAKRSAYFTKFAAVFLHAGELDRAAEFLDMAQAAADPKVTLRTVEWFWVCAEIRNAQSRFSEAAALCQQAINEASDFDQVSLPTDLMRLYNAATQAAEALGDFKSALHFKKEAFSKYEALVGQSARTKRLALQMEYEVQHAEWQRDEALTEQRVAEEEQVRLATLNRALAAANADKSRFLAAASHDLRQPVHAIGLFADTLVEQVDAGEARDMVTRIQQSMRAMNGMLSELLDISNLNAGTTRASVAAVPITSVLLHIDNEFGPTARDRGLDLRLSAPDAWVKSDPALLKRILQNLVANALAYTERGGVLVTARVRSDALLLDVWDTGVGIDAAHLPRIFDEFYQIGNMSRDRRKGMGLGLAIVRRLVDLLGHPLHVTSRAGKGTRFRLRLPIAEAIESFASHAPMPLTNLTGKLALVVDDEPDVRDGMAAALAARGCAVIVASSAVEAVARLTPTSSSPDFAVMDYRLETQTGLAALADIRAHFGWHLPALIVTGDTLASDLTHFAEAGEAWLIKPVSADDLQRAVTGLLAPTSTTDRA